MSTAVDFLKKNLAKFIQVLNRVLTDTKTLNLDPDRVLQNIWKMAGETGLYYGIALENARLPSINKSGCWLAKEGEPNLTK